MRKSECLRVAEPAKRCNYIIYTVFCVLENKNSPLIETVHSFLICFFPSFSLNALEVFPADFTIIIYVPGNSSSLLRQLNLIEWPVRPFGFPIQPLDL